MDLSASQLDVDAPPRWPAPPDSAAATGTGRPLRIAHVTEYYYPHLGGVCEHVHFFAHEARRRGHHVDIITSSIGRARHRLHVIQVGRSQPVYANGSMARSASHRMRRRPTACARAFP